MIAINEALARLGARRIGLVTPYVSELEADMIANHASTGITVTSAARLDLTVNTDYAAVSRERLAEMARDVAGADPDAIVILCTNLAGASIAPDLGRALGIPVLDSVRVAVEHSLAILSS